jgi:hypothetical protein
MNHLSHRFRHESGVKIYLRLRPERGSRRPPGMQIMVSVLLESGSTLRGLDLGLHLAPVRPERYNVVRGRVSPHLTLLGPVFFPLDQAHFCFGAGPLGPAAWRWQVEASASSWLTLSARVPEAQNEFLRRFLGFRHLGSAQGHKNRFWGRWRRSPELPAHERIGSRCRYVGGCLVSYSESM